MLPDPSTPELSSSLLNETSWLGIHYDSTSGKYVWLSNNLEISNPNWMEGEPLTNHGDCVVSYLSMWYTWPCEDYWEVICQAGYSLYVILTLACI
jgi:hypothetical protein